MEKPVRISYRLPLAPETAEVFFCHLKVIPQR